MTKDEWKRAEEALKGLFSSVKLRIDGYEVTFILQRVSVYKNAIMTYINGEFKGQWLSEDCEERRRFFQRKVHSLLSPKEKADFNKLPSKRRKALMEKYHNLTYESFFSHWTSFGALKKHLLANNQEIELISIS